MPYPRTICKLCGQRVATNGAARYNHAGRHIKEGKVKMKLSETEAYLVRGRPVSIWKYINKETGESIY